MRPFILVLVGVLLAGCGEKGYVDNPCACEYSRKDSLVLDGIHYKYGYYVSQFENSAFYENFFDYILSNKGNAYWVEFSEEIISKCDSSLFFDDKMVYYVKINGIVDIGHKGHLNQYRKGEIKLKCISVKGHSINLQW